jgi:hypothetical protein
LFVLGHARLAAQNKKEINATAWGVNGGAAPLQGVQVLPAHALLPFFPTGVLTRPLPIFRNTNFRISPKSLVRPVSACTRFPAFFCDVFLGFGDVRLLVM